MRLVHLALSLALLLSLGGCVGSQYYPKQSLVDRYSRSADHHGLGGKCKKKFADKTVGLGLQPVNGCEDALSRTYP